MQNLIKEITLDHNTHLAQITIPVPSLVCLWAGMVLMEGGSKNCAAHMRPKLTIMTAAEATVLVVSVTSLTIASSAKDKGRISRPLLERKNKKQKKTE